MIAEGHKVFTKVNAKADGMDTIFGHYAEYSEEGKLIHFMTFDDTLSMFNAMRSTIELYTHQLEKNLMGNVKSVDVKNTLSGTTNPRNAQSVKMG